jgi:hypothetical protein
VRLQRWQGRTADRWLPFWFFAWSAFRVYQLSWDGRTWDTSFLGRDFRIYRNAAVALVNGTDPWTAADHWNGFDWHFAALPTAAQLFVPFAWLPEGIGMAAFFGLTGAVSWLGLRVLELPAWWVFFPPLTEGLLAANPQILLFGLLLIGWPLAQAVAAGLKVYAVVPMVARREWVALTATLGLFAVSMILGPDLWSTYLRELGAVSGRAVQESQGGVSAALLLDPKVFGPAVPSSGTLRVLPGLLLYGLVVALVLIVAVRDVRAAGWLAVPLLWPAAEYHLATFAVPVARRLSIWIIAIATLPTYLLGLIVLSYEVASARSAMVPEPPPVGLIRWLRALTPRHRAVPPAGSFPPSAS